jgi:hypothetical protein
MIYKHLINILPSSIKTNYLFFKNLKLIKGTNLLYLVIPIFNFIPNVIYIIPKP